MRCWTSNRESRRKCQLDAQEESNRWIKCEELPGVNREQTRRPCYDTVQTTADLLLALQPRLLPAAGCPARLGKGHRAAFPWGAMARRARSPAWKRRSGGEIMTELEKIRSGLNWEGRFAASSKPMQTQSKAAGSERPKEGFASGSALLRCGHGTMQNKNLALHLKSWLSKTVRRKNHKELPVLERALEAEAAASTAPVPGRSHCLSSSYVRPRSTGQWCLQEMEEPDQGRCVLWAWIECSQRAVPHWNGKGLYTSSSKTSSTVLQEWSSVIRVYHYRAWIHSIIFHKCLVLK